MIYAQKWCGIFSGCNTLHMILPQEILPSLKKNLEFVHISDALDYKNGIAIFYKYKITEFIEFIQNWHLVYCQKPKNIFIYKENGKLRIEGKN